MLPLRPANKVRRSHSGKLPAPSVVLRTLLALLCMRGLPCYWREAITVL